MSKRKLTLQQRRRIAEQRAKRKLERAASALSSQTDDQSLSELRTGMVIAYFGHEVLIEDQGFSQKCHLRANLEICTGDRVMWRSGSELGVVESIEPRTSEIQRPDIYGKLRTVASNVSQLLITVAPEPEPHAGMIDRYLVAAHIHKLRPILLLNKIDHDHCDQLNEIEKNYRDLGYEALRVSAHSGAGMAELQAALNGNTSIFVGQSGVGKSSLIQTLLPDETIRIGALSEAEAKGRHTTTNSQLYHFPSGGYCIDSPGIREFGLWHATEQDILASFPEIENIAGACRFRDCAHESEPGCAIKSAIENKEISAARYASYQTILNQLDDVTIKTQTGIKNK